MAGLITCPGCGHKFEPTNAFRDEVQRELNLKAKEWQLKKEEEFKIKEQSLRDLLQKKENETERRLQEEKQKLQKELNESLRKSISSDFENKLQLLQQNLQDNEIKLQESRKKELEFLKKEQLLQQKEAELELKIQRKVVEERERQMAEFRKLQDERIAQIELDFKLKLAEKEKQSEDQKKLIEEMKRKAEQGSMQLQGEVQEEMLESILKHTFPFDKITPVGKGVRGADCVQIICNPFGQDCGKIIYESKRTKSFANDWIDKLKADMRNVGADIAVIVTQALPADMDRFGEKEGVYICTFNEVKSLAYILRTSILKIFSITKNQENRGDKMQLLYNYLTSGEFSEQWSAIREGFLSMRNSINTERAQMEKLWKAREKQLEKVLLNAAHIKGSIEGIAGAEAVDLNLLEDGIDD